MEVKFTTEDLCNTSLADYYRSGRIDLTHAPYGGFETIGARISVPPGKALFLIGGEHSLPAALRGKPDNEIVTSEGSNLGVTWEKDIVQYDKALKVLKGLVGFIKAPVVVAAADNLTLKRDMGEVLKLGGKTVAKNAAAVFSKPVVIQIFNRNTGGVALPPTGVNLNASTLSFKTLATWLRTVL